MTTVVQPDFFGVSSCEDAWMIANTAAVSPDYFASVTCEGQRLFGISTKCSNPNCNDACSDVLNYCARKTLWRHLYAVQQEMEAALGWTLTPRYVEETLPWQWGEHLQLTFGGVDRLNVAIDYWTHASQIAYSPFVYTAEVQAVAAATYTEILVPQWLISKPEGVILVVDATDEIIQYLDEIPGYPQSREVGGEWFWAIAIPGAAGVSPGDDVRVLDCQWGIVEFDFDFTCLDPDTAEEVEETESALVYPDTYQKIVIAKQQSGVLPGEVQTRYYWFIEHMHMVREAYQGDTVDLGDCGLELHKLYDYVDAACFYERCQLVKIRTRCRSTGTNECCCDGDVCVPQEYDACAYIVDGKRGIIAIERVALELDENDEPILGDDGCPTYRQCCEGTIDPCCDDPGEAYEVVVAYHTDPGCSGVNNTSAVETLRRAIAARVAAEVPMNTCGCDVECGWFQEMREELDTVNYSASGSMIVTLRYGRKRGQQVYAHAMYTVPRNQRVAVL